MFQAWYHLVHNYMRWTNLEISAMVPRNRLKFLTISGDCSIREELNAQNGTWDRMTWKSAEVCWMSIYKNEQQIEVGEGQTESSPWCQKSFSAFFFAFCSLKVKCSQNLLNENIVYQKYFLVCFSSVLLSTLVDIHQATYIAQCMSYRSGLWLDSMDCHSLIGVFSSTALM